MVEYIHFPQNMTSPHTIDYLISEYKRLNASYEQLSGKKITEEALRQSIALYNTQRRLVRELYAIRRETPQNLFDCRVLHPDAHRHVTASGGAHLDPRGGDPCNSVSATKSPRTGLEWSWKALLRTTAHRIARRTRIRRLLYSGRRFSYRLALVF